MAAVAADHPASASQPPDGAGPLDLGRLPALQEALLNLGWFYLAFGAFVIVGAANAVNFTDGLDGLATVPVMIAAAAFGLIAYLVGNFVFANYLQLHFVPGVGEIGGLSAGPWSAPAWASSGTTPRRPRSSWATPARWRWAAARRRGRGHQARDRAGHRRRPVRGRDPVGDDPGRLVQAHRPARSS